MFECRLSFWPAKQRKASSSGSQVKCSRPQMPVCWLPKRVVGMKAGDAGIVQIEVVGTSSVLGVRYDFWNAQAAKAAMLPQDLGEQVLVCLCTGRRDGRGDHLAAPAEHRHVRFVGEMAAELRPVDQCRFRVRPALQLLTRASATVQKAPKLLPG